VKKSRGIDPDGIANSEADLLGKLPGLCITRRSAKPPRERQQ
jgi:hypothetical protein